MPKRTDISHVMVIGSGPIVIGQACEFDYSGTQACRVLREEGLRVTLVNSNPATIMTDPDIADATYLEPITPDFVEKVIAKERPQALLATLGGQTALNTAVTLHERGVLDHYGVELIGADIEAIQRGEDRQRFKDIVRSVGGDVPRSMVCRSQPEVREAAAQLGLPVVIRPSFTMGGLGSGMAHTTTDLERLGSASLVESPVNEVLVEESVLGWKEYELELMRDRHDNVVVVCSIENIDAMGVHTGDSVTVAPAMTLTDREYQRMRNLGIAVLREVGVDTGGCNIQFAVDPRTGRMVVIEMNPRVSRSSALASKATGFPIAKIAARLALGYTLDEITNDITQQTPACFEPALDYVVVKAPRFAFDKFPNADRQLSTNMKSVGEVMALGRSFTEALGKALRSLGTHGGGFWIEPDPIDQPLDTVLARLASPHDGRLFTMEHALRLGAGVQQVADASSVDPWFCHQLQSLVKLRHSLLKEPLTAALLRQAKRAGVSDRQLAALRPELVDEQAARALRHRLGIRPVYKTVDTCAAEFAAHTPYHYSAYELDPDAETEVAEQPTRSKVIILGSGANRIGQGLEFDYSCVHAVLALQQAGYETVMINCNPETVSTDYDTADRLYFEPLTLEDVLEVVDAERSSGHVAGVIVQLGGQTPLDLAQQLADAGVPIMGTSPQAIHLAESREAFGTILAEAGLAAPPFGTAASPSQIRETAERLGYPVMVRPSYVLGGRGMEILHTRQQLEDYLTRTPHISPDRPALVDRFLENAKEIDVDALYDGQELFLGGVMEHLEPAGVHSGDSACSLPPRTLSAAVLDRVRQATTAIADAVGVRGLLNVQYALKDGQLFVLEANPRASRTVPFVSKATAVPLAKAAARLMLGASVEQLRTEQLLPASGDGMALPAGAPVAVKEAVLPFHRFPTARGEGADPQLGPEMKSTGEVMGIDTSFAPAFAKSQLAAYGSLPTAGRVVACAEEGDLAALSSPVQHLADLGFEILATYPTAEQLRHAGPDGRQIPVQGAPGQDIADAVLAGKVHLVISIPGNGPAHQDSQRIRAAAALRDVPCFTTIQATEAAAHAIQALRAGRFQLASLQELHQRMRPHSAPAGR
ncbi:carbamoyl phosphate synthase large subunit [Streptomyces sp. NRRL F-4489]|uniref:carbamoyl-phosphate synthase large subunit n=1 Tax=Streptomyces sp. NRRL F-4489 TaxID=1609095 RepID=UPI000745F6C3|nr:carbamoyl-phosphate synthase large subunit [Streptomyces sp. NRRL F-4489]KUL53512.1 carbamoyl phosphate synthase large subunit [Streptomyces sp. NRRL F-4489]